MVTISEASRIKLHSELKSVLGDDMADVLMEHLPPAGWGDVARRSDIDNLIQVIEAKFDAMEARFDAIDKRFDVVNSKFDVMDAKFDAVDTKFAAVHQRLDSMDSRINGLVHGLWALGSLTTTFFLTLVTVIITKL